MSSLHAYTILKNLCNLSFKLITNNQKPITNNQ